MQAAVETAENRNSMATDFQIQLDHLVRMATVHQQKKYAWHRAKELDKADHGMYRGMAAALTERMKQQTEKKTT